MSVIVSYLVVSKVTLAFGRYMEARKAIGEACMSLRELHQLAVLYTGSNKTADAISWRSEVSAWQSSICFV